MALQLIEGFDNQTVPPEVSLIRGNGYSYPAGRLAGYAVQLNAAGSGWGNQTQIAFPAATSSPTVGAALNCASGALPNGGGQWALCFREGSTVHVGVKVSSDGYLQLVRGDGTVLATSTVSVTLVNVWNYLELSAVIADSGGSAALSVNGQQVAAYAGDTRNGGTTGTATNVYIELANGTSAKLDDLYILDGTGAAPFNAPLGDCKVETLRPNGNGATSGWAGSDGNSVDNYLLVDDLSGTSDYVGSPTPGARDLYALGDPSTVAAGQIFAVQSWVLGCKSDAGDAPGNLELVYRSAAANVATLTLAVPAQISTSWQWYRSALSVLDPDGNAWTPARLTDLQVGVQVSA